MAEVGNGLWQYECGCIYPIEQKRRELFDAVVRCGRHSLVPSESLPISQESEEESNGI